MTDLEHMKDILDALDTGDLVEHRLIIRRGHIEPQWEDVALSIPNFIDYEYRRKPVPIERWVNIDDEGEEWLHNTDEGARNAASDTNQRIAVHMREVIDE